MKSKYCKKKLYKFIAINIIAIMTIFILATLVLLSSNNEVKREQNKRYANIVGKLTEEYGMSEQELEYIIFNNENYKNIAIGEKFLKQYGYSEGLELKYYKLNNNNIEQIIIIFIVSLISLIILAVINIYVMFSNLKKETNKLITVADKFIIYRKVDYSNIKDTIFVSRYEDKIKEISQRIALMMEEMTSERENTKELINDMTHQLKTPISSLRIFQELIKNENLSIDKRREFIKRCDNEIERVNYIMDNITNISRLETEVIQINKIKCDIGNAIIKSTEYVYGKVIEKNIDMSIESLVSKDIEHDFNWTKEAIINILDNAIKYSENNGKIIISTLDDGISYTISIKDNGMGILKDDISKVFKKFYRGKREENLKVEGTGLGLYISRLIIERQQGTIEILSEKDIGTTVNIRFYYINS